MEVLLIAAHNLQSQNVVICDRKGGEKHRTFFMFISPLDDRKINVTVFVLWIRKKSIYLESLDQSLQQILVFLLLFFSTETSTWHTWCLSSLEQVKNQT